MYASPYGEAYFFCFFIDMVKKIQERTLIMKKRIFQLIFTFCFCASCMFSACNRAVAAAPAYPEEPNARSCILMDGKTGAVLYEYNADAAYPPASVTNVMTMLLVFEALDEGTLTLDEKLRISETAAAMGGSQIFLAPGEEMSVNDLLKGLIVSSANDAAVALAEAICGSEEAFVVRMNARAAELGLVNTHFENTNGITYFPNLCSLGNAFLPSHSLCESCKDSYSLDLLVFLILKKKYPS